MFLFVQALIAFGSGYMQGWKLRAVLQIGLQFAICVCSKDNLCLGERVVWVGNV